MKEVEREINEREKLPVKEAPSSLIKYGGSELNQLDDMEPDLLRTQLDHK